MNNLKRISIYSIILLIVYLFVFSHFLLLDATSDIKNPAPVGIDFSVYYAAGQMVMNNQTADLYNHEIFHSEIDKVLERDTSQKLDWFYPPSFLLFIFPFSFFPYKIALILWLTVTFSLAVFAAYLLIPKYKEIVLLVYGFPAVLMNLRWGQNGFLNTALLGFGLYFLDRKPIFSGLMFGLLTYKPQIAFFPLILLLLTKKWKVLIWSLIFSVATVVTSALLFGLTTWYSFINSFFNSSTLLISAWEQLSAVQPTMYSVFRIFGLEHRPIIILLGIIAIIVTTFSTWVWQKTDRLALRGSVLVLGILLTMPYYVQYDLMILSLPLILLSYDCLQYGFRPYEIVILTLLWFMPLVNWPLVIFTSVQICPFILFAVLAMTFVRACNSNNLHEIQTV